MEPGGGGGGGGDSEPILPRPEHLLQLREEIEGLRAGWVSPALRARSGGQRAVTLGREPLEGCLRKLRQAQRGWGALLAETTPRGLPPHKQQTLLNLLDLGLALVARIEALRGRRKRKRGASPPPPPPKPPGPPRSGPRAGGEEEEGAGGGGELPRALQALRGRFGALQEGLLPQRDVLWPPARELQALHLDGREFTLRKAIALDEVEGRLRDALGAPLAPARKEEPSGGGPLLLGDPPQDGPALAVQMRTWRQEARALQEQLAALARASSTEEKARRWREVAGFASREFGLLNQAGRGDPRRVPPEEEEKEALGDGVWETRAALRDAFWELKLPRGGIPTEASVVALQEKVGALVEAMNSTSLEEAGGSLQETTGTFLGAGEEESRIEFLARLGISVEEMNALDRHLEGLREALENIYLSKEVDAPREKVDAVSWSVAAFKEALRAAGRAEGLVWERLGALERYVEGLPLEEMAALNEELRTLSEVLRDKAGAPEDVPWMEVGETWNMPSVGVNPTPVVAGGRRDQDGSGASGLPFPASVGASRSEATSGSKKDWNQDKSCFKHFTGRQDSLEEKKPVLVTVIPSRKRGRPRLRDRQPSITNHKLEFARSEQGR